MKIEKLTDNKIRIILNIDDLTEKNINVHTLIRNTDISQKLFTKILKQAKKEVGFDVQDSKLLIEAFVSTDGYFILTFTKLTNELSTSKSEQLVARPKAKRKKVNFLCDTAVYEFDSFDEFCSFCIYLDNSKLGTLKKFAKSISLYEYEFKYFLVFSKINTDFENVSLFYVSISEFAKLVSNSPSFASKLVEYGKIIFKSNAIENGIKYFATSKE